MSKAVENKWSGVETTPNASKTGGVALKPPRSCRTLLVALSTVGWSEIRKKKEKHNEKGGIPSHRVWVDENMLRRGVPLLMVSG